ncbi:MAG: type II toxin-antitoxin system Phd/YefM family antitoxin [Pseudomonadota bacterium]
MNTISVSEAKMKLSALVTAVQETDEEVVITRNGRPVAVLVSPDEFESWRETLTVRFDAGLMAEILKGQDSLKKGNASLYSLEELLPEP